MYDEMTKGSAFAPGYDSDDPTEGQPLSVEIMNRTSYALDQANAIVQRLWVFKDRVHGSAATAAGANGVPQTPDPSHFAGAWRQKFSLLEDAMATIDKLTSEITNRF